MKHSMLWTIPLIAVLAFLPLPAVTAAAQDDQHASHHGDWRDDDDDKDWRNNDKAPVSVTVSFGAGLNTALAGPNPDNDHILPKKIEVKAGGVVNFVVAGFHQVLAYNPGVKPQDVLDNAPVFNPAPPPAGDPQSFYINYGLRDQDDKTIVLYVGANPGAGLTSAVPSGECIDTAAATTNPFQHVQSCGVGRVSGARKVPRDLQREPSLPRRNVGMGESEQVSRS